MKHSLSSVIETTLSNGLTVLIKPQHSIPEVDIQLWYNVGSKHERDSERGMAHLIEHMIFKGTKDLLSECDLDRTVQHFAGYSNAFTSYDYTTYVFRFPSNVWDYAFTILADCMVNAKFDEQMLNSEFKAVIQELKMYRDNFKTALLEKLFGSVLAPHPYHHPIIGYKQDLWNLQRDDLYRFYKEHYYPANATLVVVGDVDPDQVIAKVQASFGKISSPLRKEEPQFFGPMPDLEQRQITLLRQVSQPWYCYAYRIPGLRSKEAHKSYMVSLLLARGKTSRLYKLLVEERKIATEVQCFDYELIDEQLLYITIQPINEHVRYEIEQCINDLLTELATHSIEQWELSMLSKKAECDFIGLLESNESTATTLGQFYVAFGSLDYISSYIDKIRETTAQELREYISTHLAACLQHAGYLEALQDSQEEKLASFQEISDKMDSAILAKRARTSDIEGPCFSLSLPTPEPVLFSYPKPQIFTLSNGLEVYWYHSEQVPKVTVQLRLKADYLYDQFSRPGMALAHGRMLLEGVQGYNAEQFHRMLEEKGIILDIGSSGIRGECLSQDMHLLLRIFAQLCMNPLMPSESLDKVKQQMFSELSDYWDEPYGYVSALASQYIYQGHPYSLFPLGTKESIAAITHEEILHHHRSYYSPIDACLVLVGDLQSYASEITLKSLIEDTFGSWQGSAVPDLIFPPLAGQQKCTIERFVQRDQAVIAFAAPSISRQDPDYDALALLDIVLCGGDTGSMSSRLFALREQTGLFYTIGGSLMYGAGKAPGMAFIKTMVSNNMVEKARDAISQVLDTIAQHGVTEQELAVAKNALLQTSISYFENNMKIASTFLFLRKYKFSFDLFDKRGVNLSIIKNERVSQLAQKYCKSGTFTSIYVGRDSFK